MSKKFWIGLVGSALMLSGCGGNGSATTPIAPLPDDGSQGNTRPGNIAPSSSLRSLAPGDVWQYTVSGRITDNTSTKNVSGTMLRVVSNDTLAGSPVLKISETMTLQPQGGVPMNIVEETYVEQASNGQLTVVGRREGTFIFEAQSNTFALPGSWELGESAAGETSMQTATGSPQARSTMSNTLTVIGTSDVVTPLGLYGSWRTERSVQGRVDYTGVTDRIQLGQSVEVGTVLSVDRTETSTEFWVPAIGSFARKSATIFTSSERIKDIIQLTPVIQYEKETVATTTTLTFSLRSTTVNR